MIILNKNMAEYKAISLYSMSTDELNEWFDNGWEYVDGFTQSVSIAAGYRCDEKGRVIVILKKNKLEL